MSIREGVKRRLPFFLGLLLILGAFVVLLRIFGPVAQAELHYQQGKNNPSQSAVIPCPESSFTISIPKLNLCASVIPQVDPYDSYIYQRALTQGVAHAKGTSLPGQEGNIFLFAHSAGNPLDASRYNSLFYLLAKLNPGDAITLSYQGTKYSYVVDHLTKVNPNELQYLTNSHDDTLTLMTCWPPGTTLKRLLVVAKPVAM